MIRMTMRIRELIKRKLKYVEIKDAGWFVNIKKWIAVLSISFPSFNFNSCFIFKLVDKGLILEI